MGGGGEGSILRPACSSLTVNLPFCLSISGLDLSSSKVVCLG